MITVNTLQPCLVDIQYHPRAIKLITSAKRVVARKKVRLANGETNNIRLVTRSVTNCNMREHALTTTVLAIGRAFEQPFANAMISHPNCSTIPEENASEKSKKKFRIKNSTIYSDLQKRYQ